MVRRPRCAGSGGRGRAALTLAGRGAGHEMLMEADRFRAQVLAAFDAFVPGTPLFA